MTTLFQPIPSHRNYSLLRPVHCVHCGLASIPNSNSTQGTRFGFTPKDPSQPLTPLRFSVQIYVLQTKSILLRLWDLDILGNPSIGELHIKFSGFRNKPPNIVYHNIDSRIFPLFNSLHFTAQNAKITEYLHFRSLLILPTRHPQKRLRLYQCILIISSSSPVFPPTRTTPSLPPPPLSLSNPQFKLSRRLRPLPCHPLVINFSPLNYRIHHSGFSAQQKGDVDHVVQIRATAQCGGRLQYLFIRPSHLFRCVARGHFYYGQSVYLPTGSRQIKTKIKR